MAKVCRQCGREFENRSVRCPICKLELDSCEADSSEIARLQNQRIQQRRQTRALQAMLAQDTQMQDMQEQARQPQARQKQARQPQARQEQARQPQARQEQTRQEQARQEQVRQPQARQPQALQEQKRMDNGKKSAVFTVRNVLRVLSVVCLAMVFCPVFLVSCAGESMEVSVMTAVGGVSVYGEKFADPYPVMLICLAIPVMILLLLFARRSAGKKNGIVIAAGAVTDFAVWMIFKSAVKKAAEGYLCDFKTTGWYALNMAALALIILFAVLVAVRKLYLDDDLAAAISRRRKRTG